MIPACCLIYSSTPEILSTDRFELAIPRYLPGSFAGDLFSVKYGISIGWQDEPTSPPQYVDKIFCSGGADIAKIKINMEQYSAEKLWRKFQIATLEGTRVPREKIVETRTFSLVRPDEEEICNVKISEVFVGEFCLVEVGKDVNVLLDFGDNAGVCHAQILMYEIAGNERAVVVVAESRSLFGVVYPRLRVPRDLVKAFLVGEYEVKYELVLRMRPNVGDAVVWSYEVSVVEPLVFKTASE